jgi:hypothetical protein
MCAHICHAHIHRYAYACIHAINMHRYSYAYTHAYIFKYGFTVSDSVFLFLVSWVMMSWKDFGFCHVHFPYDLRWSCVFILHLVNVMYHIDWFSYVEPFFFYFFIFLLFTCAYNAWVISPPLPPPPAEPFLSSRNKIWNFGSGILFGCSNSCFTVPLNSVC